MKELLGTLAGGVIGGTEYLTGQYHFPKGRITKTPFSADNSPMKAYSTGINERKL